MAFGASRLGAGKHRHDGMDDLVGESGTILRNQQPQWSAEAGACPAGLQTFREAAWSSTRRSTRLLIQSTLDSTSLSEIRPFQVDRTNFEVRRRAGTPDISGGRCRPVPRHIGRLPRGLRRGRPSRAVSQGQPAPRQGEHSDEHGSICVADPRDGRPGAGLPGGRFVTGDVNGDFAVDRVDLRIIRHLIRTRGIGATPRWSPRPRSTETAVSITATCSRPPEPGGVDLASPAERDGGGGLGRRRRPSIVQSRTVGLPSARRTQPRRSP